MRHRELLKNRLGKLDGTLRKIEYIISRPVSSTQEISQEIDNGKELVEECQSIIDRIDMSPNEINPHLK